MVLAEYVFFLLNLFIRHVLMIEEGEDPSLDRLIDVGPEDRLPAVTFRPYARLTADVVDWFARAGGAVVLVCDDPLILLAALARHTLVCAPESPGPFASAVAGCSWSRRSRPTWPQARREARSADSDAAQELWARFGTY